MLEVKNLNFSYDGNNKILNNLNLRFQRGCVVAIKGESGQGKTTLLSILSGLENQYQGDLILDDVVYSKQDLRKYNKDNVCIIFQEHNLIKYLNLSENIQQGCIVKGKTIDNEKLQKYIKTFRLQELDFKKYPSTISGGQQQRIAIIRALLTNAEIILADEPTASIDEKNANEILKELKTLAKENNKIVIIVTHSKEVAKQCDMTYLLENGSLKNI